MAPSTLLSPQDNWGNRISISASSSSNSSSSSSSSGSSGSSGGSNGCEKALTRDTGNKQILANTNSPTGSSWHSQPPESIGTQAEASVRAAREQLHASSEFVAGSEVQKLPGARIGDAHCASVVHAAAINSLSAAERNAELGLKQQQLEYTPSEADKAPAFRQPVGGHGELDELTGNVGSPSPPSSSPSSPPSTLVAPSARRFQNTDRQKRDENNIDSHSPSKNVSVVKDNAGPIFCAVTAETNATNDSVATNRAPLVNNSQQQHHQRDTDQTIELRFLVRRREAGALIGKRGSNIKRLRESFRSSMFSIPDTGNGPERVVCIATDPKSMDLILTDLTQLLMEKSPENDDQIELKLLIHSSHAGSIIGIGGQSIKKLRNDSRAAIKIYEMCCPLSNERVCAIKAKPPVVVSTIKLILGILNENPIKGTIKPYDALHFDLSLIDKYGGYLSDEALELSAAIAGIGQQHTAAVAAAAQHHLATAHHHHRYQPHQHQHQHPHQHQHDQTALANYTRQLHEDMYSAAVAAATAAAAAASASNGGPKQHYSAWRSPEFRETCELAELSSRPDAMPFGSPQLSGRQSNSSIGQQQQPQRVLKKSFVSGDCDEPNGPSATKRFYPYAHHSHSHQHHNQHEFPGYCLQQARISANNRYQQQLLLGPSRFHSFGPLKGTHHCGARVSGHQHNHLHHNIQNQPQERTTACPRSTNACMCMVMPMIQQPNHQQQVNQHHSMMQPASQDSNTSANANANANLTATTTTSTVPAQDPTTTAPSYAQSNGTDSKNLTLPRSSTYQ